MPMWNHPDGTWRANKGLDVRTFRSADAAAYWLLDPPGPYYYAAPPVDQSQFRIDDKGVWWEVLR